MVYEGFSFDVEMLIQDEWYLWDDFVHFVRYRLGQLSFTYDRRSIRQHLDLPRSLVNICDIVIHSWFYVQKNVQSNVSSVFTS